MAERHPKWTQLELAKWAYETFQLPKIPSQGTISRLLAKKSTYMNCKEHEKDANRLRKPNNSLVRKILQEWISQSLWNGIPITSPIIQDTAQSVWHRIPSEYREGNGSFSYKWIANFLAKMDVNISALDSELPKTPKIWTFEERAVLKQYFSKVPSVKDLFTLDETFLAYNLPLDYEQYETSKIQRRIEVASVMLCSNLDGSEKIKPLVVGKYNSYKSFRNYFPDEPEDAVSQSQLGEKMAKKFDISYHSNRKSWLTSNLFHNWLVRWDKRLVADNRKIWIVLDDSCSHRVINLHLQNIQLVYTSSNSRFLPFNWGVLDEFKTRYRIQQYEALIKLQKQIEKTSNKRTLINFEQSQLTMSNAFKFIKKAWDDIPADTIKSNWKSSGLLPPGMIQTNDAVSMAFKKNEVLESALNALCNEFYCKKKWEYDMLLDLNIENKNTNFLSTEELVESAIVDPMEPDNLQSHTIINSTATSQFADDDAPYNRLSMFDNDDVENGKNNLASVDHLTGNFDLTPFTNVSNSISLNHDANTSTTNNVNHNNTATTTTNNHHSLAVADHHNYSEPNLNKLLGETFDPTKSENLFNVSTLIDNPDLFIDPTAALDLPLQSSEYFTVFPNSVPTGQQVNDSISSTNVNTGVLNNRSIISSNSSETSLLNADTTNDFEVPNLNHILNNSEQIALEYGSHIPEKISPSEEVSSLTNLQTSVDIAKSLGDVLKHTEANELILSKATVEEIHFAYSSLLRKIKKTRKQLNKSKTKMPSTNLESLIIQDSNVVNRTQASLSSKRNMQLQGNNAFF